MYNPISDCRLCRGTSLQSLVDVGSQALTGIFPKTAADFVPVAPLILIKCFDCGLVQLAHNYQLSMLYGDNYGYRSGLNASMVRHLKGIVAKIQNSVSLAPGDLVIDIGSNDGTTLAAYTIPGLRRVGMDPTGLKFKEYYPAGVELIPEFFTASKLSRHVDGHKAKVVTSIAMFYDLERPSDFVRDIVEVLDDEGLWLFEQSYLPQMLATNSYDTICHEHLEYYTVKQIEYIVRQAGLRIIDVEFSDTNGGSFAVIAAKKSSPYPDAADLVNRIIADETAAGFDTLQPFEDLKRAMEKHRSDLRQLLVDLRDQGKSVIGYGASTKGNVLLQYCGIDRELLPCIAEVNPDKFGSVTPGTHIPIISEREARAARPDYFLVLPWHFREGIVEKEAGYLDAGGKLIFPLPELQIVETAGRQVQHAS